MLEITRRKREGVLVFAITGELTGELPETLLGHTYRALEAGARKFLLNLEKFKGGDWRALREVVNVVRDRGGEVKFLSPPAGLVENALRMPGLEAYETEAEALASFAEAASEPESAGPALPEKGGVELVQIPAGSFSMGSPETEKGRDYYEGPHHAVTLRAFEIGKYAVTNEEYRRFLDANPDAAKPAYWTDENYNQPRQPVVGVSRDEAKAFAAWAGCRLPSEAEWEYAARAETTEPYLEGATEEVLDRFAWYSKNSERKLHPVGEKQPNAWGLYDVLGNVSEWVEDDLHLSYQDAPGDGAAWVGATRGSVGVLRGGAFPDPPQFVRVATRLGSDFDYGAYTTGFRVVRSRSGGGSTSAYPSVTTR